MNEVLSAIQADLRDNASGFLRALAALSVYKRFSPLVLENAQKCVGEVLRMVGVDTTDALPTTTGKNISYANLEPREAAAIDLLVFGENRTVEQVQEHVFEMDFTKGREGQIRSSVNARGNRDVYFQVGPDDKVSLTSKGKRLAQEVKERLGL